MRLMFNFFFFPFTVEMIENYPCRSFCGARVNGLVGAGIKVMLYLKYYEIDNEDLGILPLVQNTRNNF